MSKDRIGTAMGSAQSVVHPVLVRVASSWIDQEMVTIRKMAAAGETADDIGAAFGKTAAWARNYIRRNKLVWNHPREHVGRHLVQSAASIGGHIKMQHGSWVEEGTRLRSEGMSVPDIAKRTGKPEPTIYSHFRRHGDPLNDPVKRKLLASRSGMLALILRLHAEGVLSEEQVADATKLAPVDIRASIATPDPQMRAAS